MSKVRNGRQATFERDPEQLMVGRTKAAKGESRQMKNK